MIEKLAVLTVKSELPSAKLLGFDTFLEPEDIPENVYTTILRWGYGEPEEVYTSVLNAGPAIALNVRKYSATIKLSEVVKTPKVFIKSVPAGRYVQRPFRHSKGVGFKLITGPIGLPTGHYASEVLTSDTEFRVWFSPKRCLAGLRVPITDEQSTENESPVPCRAEWGYSFRGTPKELSDVVCRARDHIGLDYGAADIVMMAGVPYFLELNSAPSIDCPRLIKFFKDELSVYHR